jgi:hypothetical protein
MLQILTELVDKANIPGLTIKVTVKPFYPLKYTATVYRGKCALYTVFCNRAGLAAYRLLTQEIKLLKELNND